MLLLMLVSRCYNSTLVVVSKTVARWSSVIQSLSSLTSRAIKAASDSSHRNDERRDRRVFELHAVREGSKARFDVRCAHRWRMLCHTYILHMRGHGLWANGSVNWKRVGRSFMWPAVKSRVRLGTPTRLERIEIRTIRNQQLSCRSSLLGEMSQ